MVGIPAKCFDCGQILHYDGSQCMYYCPECEAKKAETTRVKELKKAA